ncbi:MAG: uL22 family ribosomal protein, partial [Sweet potato little leaf phytoplasma]|nr:uL22 family ribosomal protein [Sweet potato little leaf phytoplasma]
VNNFNFNINNLYVKKIFVNQGVRMKRLLPRAKGRSNHVQTGLLHCILKENSCRLLQYKGQIFLLGEWQRYTP